MGGKGIGNKYEETDPTQGRYTSETGGEKKK